MKKLTALVSALVLALTLTFSSFAAPQSYNDKKAEMFYDFCMNFFAANLEPGTPLWNTNVNFIEAVCLLSKGFFVENIDPYVEITGDDRLLINMLGISGVFDFLFWPEEIWILQEAVEQNVIQEDFYFEVSTDGKIISADGKSYKEILVELGLEEPDELEEASRYSVLDDRELAETILNRLDILVAVLIIALGLGFAICFCCVIYQALNGFL